MIGLSVVGLCLAIVQVYFYAYVLFLPNLI